jgi:hypothetical protein
MKAGRSVWLTVGLLTAVDGAGAGGDVAAAVKDNTGGPPGVTILR